MCSGPREQISLEVTLCFKIHAFPRVFFLNYFTNEIHHIIHMCLAFIPPPPPPFLRIRKDTRCLKLRLSHFRSNGLCPLQLNNELVAWPSFIWIANLFTLFKTRRVIFRSWCQKSSRYCWNKLVYAYACMWQIEKLLTDLNLEVSHRSSDRSLLSKNNNHAPRIAPIVCRPGLSCAEETTSKYGRSAAACIHVGVRQ